jgi:hypothetical protein
MQGYNSNIEMYRDTTERRNIQKKVGTMPEQYGHGDQPFKTYKTKQKKGRTTTEQETYNEVRKKQRQ